MKKKPKIWVIALGVLVAAGMIGAIVDRAKAPEMRVAPVSVVTEAPTSTPAPAPKPTSTPTPEPKPTSTPAPIQTLAPAPAEEVPVPDRSAPAADPTPTPAPERDYVINTNTGKFHVPSCSSVKDIKEHNRKDVHATRDSVIAQGYSPCGKCKP